MGGNVIGLVLSAVVVCGLPGTASARPSPQVRALLLNDGIVPADVAERAKSEVTRLYWLIDVEVVWIEEATASEGEVLSIKVTTWEPRDDQFAAALGMTPTPKGQPGTRGYVFWGRVRRSAQKYAASFDAVLAAAMAHEIGHMLLPVGSHAKMGLMHEAWDSNDFRSAAAGLLHFSPESAAAIRRGLAPEVAAGAKQ